MNMVNSQAVRFALNSKSCKPPHMGESKLRDRHDFSPFSFPSKMCRSRQAGTRPSPSSTFRLTAYAYPLSTYGQQVLVRFFHVTSSTPTSEVEIQDYSSVSLPVPCTLPLNQLHDSVIDTAGLVCAVDLFPVPQTSATCTISPSPVLFAQRPDHTP